MDWTPVWRPLKCLRAISRDRILKKGHGRIPTDPSFTNTLPHINQCSINSATDTASWYKSTPHPSTFTISSTQHDLSRWYNIKHNFMRVTANFHISFYPSFIMNFMVKTSLDASHIRQTPVTRKTNASIISPFTSTLKIFCILLLLLLLISRAFLRYQARFGCCSLLTNKSRYYV